MEVFPHIFFAGVEPVSQDKLQHGFGRTVGALGEAFESVLVHGGKSDRSHRGILAGRVGAFGQAYTRMVMKEKFSIKSSAVHSDPEILGGTPVFVGTRVPVKSLFDHLEAGDSLDEFLEGFPSVSREQAVAALEMAREMTEAHAATAR